MPKQERQMRLTRRQNTRAKTTEQQGPIVPHHSLRPIVPHHSLRRARTALQQTIANPPKKKRAHETIEGGAGVGNPETIEDEMLEEGGAAAAKGHCIYPRFTRRHARKALQEAIANPPETIEDEMLEEGGAAAAEQVEEGDIEAE